MMHWFDFYKSKFEFMIGKRLSTIVFLIAVAVLASAQTTKSMNKDNKEKIPLYSYS